MIPLKFQIKALALVLLNLTQILALTKDLLCLVMGGVGVLNVDLKDENEESQEVHSQALFFLRELDTLKESA